MFENKSAKEKSAFSMKVNDDDHGKRFDCFVAENLEDCSRNLISDLISRGIILVNNSRKKPAYKVRLCDSITGSIPSPPPLSFKPEKIDLDIIFEDDDIVVLNKQAGLVVHPAPGNWSGTLVNALLYHFPGIEDSEGEIRPGIVHRLDKDTSGAMVVAKTRKAHLRLSGAFKSRAVHKAYSAVLYGRLKEDKGIIDLPVGRHPSDRKKMSVKSKNGRHAETHWVVQERFSGATLVDCVIKTGRTHQIRVHCQSMGHPVVGDPVYAGKKKSFNKQYGKENLALFQQISRQMLHSRHLKFTHPITDKELVFEAALPCDMNYLINKLKKI